MAERRLARLFWRALDRVDYWITLARLRAMDRAYGPLPDTHRSGCYDPE
jgi:hypothetical protein